MDPELCERFHILVEHYPDELNDSEEHDMHNIAGIRGYCPRGDSTYNTCITELDKINAACLWLFNKNITYRLDELSNEQFEAFIIYIMIWLNHKLNLNKDDKTNLNNLYANYIENDENYINCKDNGKDCNSKFKEKTGYNNFKEIIDKRKDLLNIKFEDISKLYDAFKFLCKMHTEYEDNLGCTEYLGYANKIVDKFKKLNENSSVTGNTSYSLVWSTLSTDYNNFKKNYNDTNCTNIPSLPPIKSTQNHIQSSGVTSSSLSIGSLFVLRKRAQKQHLREKLKNIKKRMNH
ncbi:YIR protein [Plasmodium yoelii]|uniref:YIR protein n=1 Tax=Plasmodium yoelii TaxID=5861 RepID=A0A077TSX8_PLAYE|nr:YIR protein [Plasmodium yoelii]